MAFGGFGGVGDFAWSGAAAPPDLTEPTIQSAVTDGETVTLTYDETLAVVPSPTAYSFGGDPTDVFPNWVYGAGTTAVTIPLSKPVYTGQTLTITSTDGPEDGSGNAAANLTDFEVTNNSTLEAPSLVTSGLIHDWSADAGVTHSGDGSSVTAVADQSVGSDLEPADAGGPTYRATGWIDGTPAIDWTNNTGLRTTHASVISAFTGAAEWTVMHLVQPNGNSNTNYWWSVGDEARVSGSHWISHLAGLQQMRAQSAMSGASFIRTVTSYTEYTKSPYPTVFVWRKVGSVIQCFFDGHELTYDSSSYAINLSTHDTFLWGLGFSGPNETGFGRHMAKRGLIYSRALSDSEVDQSSRYLAVYGSIPTAGALFGEAVSA